GIGLGQERRRRAVLAALRLVQVAHHLIADSHQPSKPFQQKLHRYSPSSAALPARPTITSSMPWRRILNIVSASRRASLVEVAAAICTAISSISGASATRSSSG